MKISCPYCNTLHGVEEKYCSVCGRAQAVPVSRIRDCMLLALRRVFQFRGRSCRNEYWVWWGMVLMVFIFFNFVDTTHRCFPTLIPYPHVVGIICVVTMLIIIPLLSGSVVVRRLHDVGWSDRWVLLLLAIPCFHTLLYLLHKTGTVEVVQPLFNVVFPVTFILWPPLNVVFLLILGCIDSQKGRNQHGSSLKYPSE